MRPAPDSRVTKPQKTRRKKKHKRNQRCMLETLYYENNVIKKRDTIDRTGVVLFLHSFFTWAARPPPLPWVREAAAAGEVLRK